MLNRRRNVQPWFPESRPGTANKVTEEEELKSTRTSEKGSGRTTLALALLVLIVAVVYFVATRNSSVQNAFSSIKESTQDAATTSRVRTALLLSKQVSPFDVKVQTIQGEVTLEGQVASEQVKTVAGAIAQDTSSVKQVHNNLSVNPSTERNPDREHLGERVADLEIQTLVSDALSKNADWAEKHIATVVKNKSVTLSGTVQRVVQKYTADQAISLARPLMLTIIESAPCQVKEAPLFSSLFGNLFVTAPASYRLFRVRQIRGRSRKLM
jgi:osmotically-inducible protein OsmY